MARKKDNLSGWLIIGVIFFPILIIYEFFKIIEAIANIFGNSTNNQTSRNYNISFSEDIQNQLSKIDMLDGWQFEEYVSSLLKRIGYKNVKVTSGSGDFGADVIAEKDGQKIAFQCKRFSDRVGPKVVGEVLRGMNRYNCTKGIIITNNYFTDQAIKEAQISHIELWDRQKIGNILKNGCENKWQNSKKSKSKTIICKNCQVDNSYKRERCWLCGKLLEKNIEEEKNNTNEDENSKQGNNSTTDNANSRIRNDKIVTNLNIMNDDIENEFNESDGLSYKKSIEEITYDGYSMEEAKQYIDNKNIDWNKQATTAAKNYLKNLSFSHKGLIDQLIFDNFTKAQATFGADNCGANWNEQAIKKSNEYLKNSSFSYSGLIEQLEYEGFTKKEAKYGADNCDADWKQQAVLKAKEYIKLSDFTYFDLVNQLTEGENFTEEEAVYGADNCEVNWKENNKKYVKKIIKNNPCSLEELYYNLENKGYNNDEIKEIVNDCNINWYEQAISVAKKYLKNNCYSHYEIKCTLEEKGFSEEEAKYGADNCGADWNKQALKAIKRKLKYSLSSKKIL